jgi:hypothetical protein
MRRSVIASLVIGLVLIAMPASATVPRVYEGKTSQGKRLTVALAKHADGSLSLRSMEFSALILTCSVDASTQTWGVGMGWFGGGPQLEGRRLRVDEVDPFAAIHVHGKVRATQIDGTLLRFSVASLTQDEQAQLCSTGDLTWSATRTVPAPATAERTPVGTTIVRTVGDVTITLTRLR